MCLVTRLAHGVVDDAYFGVRSKPSRHVLSESCAFLGRRRRKDPYRTELLGRDVPTIAPHHSILRLIAGLAAVEDAQPAAQSGRARRDCGSDA